ncbi:MAG: YopX family protein [Candidatus Omnitrophota bacterium]|jgi:uncharacterized phage protein (TIGR01671 family)
MREIKFKAWNSKEKEWIADGNVMDLYYSARCNSFMFDNDNYDLPDDIVFCQFTGLKDVQGKDIYEGDILKRGETTDLVVFRDGAFCVCFTSNHWHKDYTKTMHETIVNGPNRWKIIGNVFEHPDLLK